MDKKEFVEKLIELRNLSASTPRKEDLLECINFIKSPEADSLIVSINDKFESDKLQMYLFMWLVSKYLDSAIKELKDLSSVVQRFNGAYTEEEKEGIGKLRRVFEELVAVTKIEGDGNMTRLEQSLPWVNKSLQSALSEAINLLNNHENKRRYLSDKDSTPTERKVAYGQIVDDWFKKHIAELYQEMVKPGSPLLVSNESKLTEAERTRLGESIQKYGTCVWTPKGDAPASSLLKRLKSYIEYEQKHNDILTDSELKNISGIDTGKEVFISEGGDEGSDEEAVKEQEKVKAQEGENKDSTEGQDNGTPAEEPKNGNETNP